MEGAIFGSCRRAFSSPLISRFGVFAIPDICCASSSLRLTFSVPKDGGSSAASQCSSRAHEHMPIKCRSPACLSRWGMAHDATLHDTNASTPQFTGRLHICSAPTLNSRLNFQTRSPATCSCRVLRETHGKIPVEADDDRTPLGAKTWKQGAQKSAKSFLPPHSCPGKACVGATEGKRSPIGCNPPRSLAMFRLVGMLNVASKSRLLRPSPKPMLHQPLVLALIRGRTEHRVSLRNVEYRLIRRV